MTDASKRFRVACEFMLRWIFSPEFAERHRAERPVQYDIVRRLFSEMNRDRSDAEFIQNEAIKGTFAEGQISAVWLSPEFTAPLFAGLAYFYGSTLVPDGGCCFRPTITRDEDAFFGFRLDGVTLDRETHEKELMMCLCAGAATKALMTKADALSGAFEACLMLSGSEHAPDL
ncbi:hypothetical protein AD951_07685 [Acetobacter malorum]|uniref:Uncharacterized protein n=1 Tax=Acetobacter malorum TaxID=178901 RepID=A0A149UMS1_9PROT|nr:hypothetical protein [Acetobacter malorum]KXV69212.1 hypothetical protein AD951_07685 [Acetobacter malorum]